MCLQTSSLTNNNNYYCTNTLTLFVVFFFVIELLSISYCLFITGCMNKNDWNQTLLFKRCSYITRREGSEEEEEEESYMKLLAQNKAIAIMKCNY